MIKPLGPHSFVKLVDWHGGQGAIVNAARISLAQQIPDDVLRQEDEGLIRFLMREKHGTPFEHGFQSSWHLRVPIFVARELVRHRIGTSYNEESGRYVELRPDFYIPRIEDVRTQVGKPGAYSYAPVDYETADDFCEQLKYNSEFAFEQYENAIAAGVAREQARFFLPVNIFTEIRWTANARSLMKFFELRNEENAQWEIREVAMAIEGHFYGYMTKVHDAFVDNGRIAP